jgi:hypothetical protein
VRPPYDTVTNQQPDTTDPQPSDPPDQADAVRCIRARDPARPRPLSALDNADLLPPLFTDDLLATMMAALPSPERETVDQRTDHVTAAIIAIRSFDAQEPIEAILAIHVVLAHHAAMACYRRAAQANQPPALASRLFGNGEPVSRDDRRVAQPGPTPGPFHAALRPGPLPMPAIEFPWDIPTGSAAAAG